MTGDRQVWQTTRQALVILGLLCLQYFAWASHSLTLFNGLATPLFLALAAYLAILATQYRIKARPRSLCLYLLFAAWVVFADAQSGEFLPALAKDAHWLTLPIACLLIACVLREYASARTLFRIGASICIVYFLLRAYVDAEWYDTWRRVPVFGSPRHLGLTMGIASLFLFGSREQNQALRIVFRIVRILGLATMFWTGTRSAILSWGICMAVILYCDPKQVWEMVLDNCIAIGLSFLQPPPYHTGENALPQFLGGTPIRPINEVTLDSLSSARISIWWSSIRSIDEQGRLWIGVGGNGFARLQTLYGGAISYPGHVQAHNAIVQSICDAGITGTLILLGFAWSTLWQPIVACLKKKDALPVAGITYITITGMLDATLYHLEHLVYLSILIGLLYAGHGQAGQRETTTIRIPPQVTCLILIFLSVAHLMTLDYRIGLYWYFPTQ